MTTIINNIATAAATTSQNNINIIIDPHPTTNTDVNNTIVIDSNNNYKLFEHLFIGTFVLASLWGCCICCGIAYVIFGICMQGGDSVCDGVDNKFKCIFAVIIIATMGCAHVSSIILDVFCDGKKKVISSIHLIIQLLICICSFMSALALSNNLGLESRDLNAAIAIFCATVSFLLSCLRYAPAKAKVDSAFVREQKSRKLLMLVIMISTISDAVFDIIQGIAILNGEEYTASAFTYLVLGTVIGASEESVEIILEFVQLIIDFMDDSKEICKCFIYVLVVFFIVMTMAEIAIAIYLALSYNLVLQIIAITVEVLLAIMGASSIYISKEM